ncbi:hypothetical protein Bca4012_055499 [Brassica carinata]
MTQLGGCDQSISAEEEQEEDGDLCRICRSPEEPGNPLRYPCSCRGSIKYVHQDCLLIWLNRRGYKQCEVNKGSCLASFRRWVFDFALVYVCGRSYSLVPVYSENAPERLPCNEFLIEVLLRAARYTKLVVPWIAVILLNTYLVSFHPWAQEMAAADFFESSDSSWMSWELAYLRPCLLYNSFVSSFMTMATMIRTDFGDVDVRRFGRVVEVLWKYLTILCVWHHQKLVDILGQPLRPVVLPQNAQIHEFGVIRQLLFFMDDDAFALLAISVYVSTLFVLLPVWIGWVVLASVGGSFLSANSPVVLGYMTMLSTCFAYFTLPLIPFPAIVPWFSLGVHFIALKLPFLLWVKSCKILQRQTSFPAIVQWVSLGFHFIAVILPPLLWILIKDAFVLCVKIGVCPWIIGCWLEICTSPLFGARFFQRFETFSDLPCMTALRWCSGILCLLVAESFMKRIQEIIHKRAFGYLLDVTDPDYKITKMNFGYTFFALASHGVLLVIMFHLPIRAITLISPSFFPLELWAMDDKVSFGARFVYVRLLMSSPKWLIGLTKPAVELIVQNWIITVSSWLELSDFLLVVPRGEDFHGADQNVRPMMQPKSLVLFYSLAEGSMVTLHGSQNAEEDVKDQRDNRFLLRVALMLVLAALSLFIVSTAFMALPILLGRGFLESVSFLMLRYYGLKRDDLCAFWIGYNTWREIYTSICFVSDHIHKGKTDLLLKAVFEWIQDGLLFSIWITVIPGLLGLLIDLMIIIPTRVPLNESPVYFLIQDWLIGVVVLHIWAFLTIRTPINWFATEAWRRKFERIRTVGIDRLPSMWLLREVIGSIVTTLLITLSIPYLLVKYLFPLLGYQESVNSAVERLIWPALLALLVVWFMVKITHEIVIYLHQLVFNERYLVGERLDNLAEEEDIELRI